jgi:hypothetical protein
LTFLIFNNYLFAEVDLGVGFSPWDYSPVENNVKQENPPDSFIKTLASETGQDDKELAKLFNNGAGRNELIKLILISSKSKVKLKEIYALRQKNMRLSNIAQKYGLDYRDILDETKPLRQKIDYELSLSTTSITPAEVIKSTGQNK